ncbi:MAG: D-2-hydroxyacid dehydrogenase family protein [Betaproteobacteria bacterium]
MKIAILDDYQQIAMQSADWASLPQDTEVKSFNQHIADQAEVIKQLQPYEVIIAMRERTPFPAQVIDALPNLKLLVSTGARNASIDSAACERRKISLSWAHGTKSAQSSTSEVAWALILALFKRMPQSEKAMRSGGWQEHVMTESLAGKTLGVLGLGRLGQFVAQYGRAFGMNVIAWSPNLTDERAAAVSVRRVTKEALFAESDVISVHLVLSARTRGIVGAAEIAAMKPTAYLVNTSRGPLIEEQALIGALKAKKIAGAGLDVFWTEPLQNDHVLRSLDNAVLTPHVGYVVDDNMKMFYVNALKNIQNWMAGEPLTPMK